MSRHGFNDDCDFEDRDDILRYGRWRGALRSAIRGKNGQALLREMRDALDAMPEKRLIAEELVNDEGEHCALGVVGAARGIDMTKIDVEEPEQVSAAFGVNEKLVREIEYMNDEWYDAQTPEERWVGMRNWVDRQIIEPKSFPAPQEG